MKKLILCSLIIISTSLFGQEINPSRKNEIKWNALGIFFYNRVQLSFETELTPNNSLGVIASYLKYNDELDAEDFNSTDESFEIGGYYRRYFSKPNKKLRFFGDAYLMYHHFNEQINTKNTATQVWQTETNNLQDVILGINLGGKYIFKNNFLIEANFGLGKGVSNVSAFSFPSLVRTTRLGIAFGYRF
jgi:hypothetical protein